MPKQSPQRRDFIKTTALAGVGFWTSSASLLAESKSPNEKLNIGIIGAGGKGNVDRREVSSENIVAICDVDENQANEARKANPKAKFYFDFREMLDKEKLDAVTVSTPDHTHAQASVRAMRMGLHVYCQKPLTHTVAEARLMTETARKHKVATQMGNQGTSHDGLRRAVEIVQDGAIGQVTEVHVWTNRPGNYWKQGLNRPTRTDKVPASLKWDLWLGTSPERPFVGNRTYHPFAWRGWWDFGTGALGDMACHTANMAYMALKLGAPASVSSQSSGGTPESPPLWSTITWEFPARRHGSGESHLVRRPARRQAEHAFSRCGPRRQAAADGIGIDRLQGSSLFAERLRQFVHTAAEGGIRWLQGAGQVVAPFARPLQGMDPGLQGWAGRNVELRLCGAALRVCLVGQPGLANRQEVAVGLRESEMRELPRGRPVHPRRISKRL